MSRSRSLWVRVLQGLFADGTAPAVPPPRQSVGQILREARSPESGVRSRGTGRFLIWLAVTAAGWINMSGGGWAALGTPDPVPVVVRCAGGREMDLALGHARSMGLERATLRVRAGSLFEAHPPPVKIEVHAPSPEQEPQNGALLSLKFSSAAPPVRFELLVPGEPLPEVLECRAAALEPAGLMRQRAAARGLELRLERLSGGQLQPLGDGRTLWEYGVRVTGQGPATSVRQLLTDLDGADWLLHVEDLEVALDGPRARFTLEGTLIAGGAPGTAALALTLGERRIVAVEPDDALAVLPPEIALVQRAGARLAVITPRRSGAARLRVRGESSREIAFTVAPGSALPRPVASAAPEMPRGARPPPFPRLLGTSVAEQGAHALFTDKDAKQGDAIGPFRVAQVTEEGVRLSWQGRRFFVPLSGSPREEVELEGTDQDIGSSKAETR